MNEVKPPYRFGILSLGLFGIAALWFAVCLVWHLPVSIMLPGTTLPACGGVAVGLIGILPGNPSRAAAVLGTLLNSGCLVFVLQRWLLWGI